MPITDTKTGRGFSDYGTVTDTKGSTVTVRQSSAACVDAVWIFANHPDPNYENPSPHLNKAQVLELIMILAHAAMHMEDEEPDDDETEDEETEE